MSNNRNFTHAQMVHQLAKGPVTILEKLTPSQLDLWHAATGIAGEAGELLDAIKKHAIYNKPLDRVNLIEELGDMEFYLEHLRQAAGVTRDEVIEGNIFKLVEGPNARYKGMIYSDTAANARADKVIGINVLLTDLANLDDHLLSVTERMDD